MCFKPACIGKPITFFLGFYTNEYYSKIEVLTVNWSGSNTLVSEEQILISVKLVYSQVIQISVKSLASDSVCLTDQNPDLSSPML